ncbi:UDP pyrophosphate synthetase [Salmonella enterica subsp. enterica]|uniref:UDP pyrophosphate synthetase n=1 Tax=Salmonella enterica I TaxID=59201 RepID=A0A447MXT2_SALET|nr:UDP pyrophosphate synthetase [Salmonella enterica subsp. enterica]
MCIKASVFLSTAKSFQGQKTRYVVCNSTSKRKFCQHMAAVMLPLIYWMAMVAGRKSKGKIRAFGHKAGAKSVRASGLFCCQ